MGSVIECQNQVPVREPRPDPVVGTWGCTYNSERVPGRTGVGDVGDTC
jgi:hypothetical protein